MEKLILCVIGISAGVLVACGLCALITTVGVITRMAWKTKTMDKIRIYENSMILGAVTAVFIYLILPDLYINDVVGNIFLAITGVFTGLFVGCLAMSLAESLDASAVLFRRIKLRENTKYIILAAALGKFVGNLFYFMK